MAAITPWVPTPSKIKDGDDVSAGVINPIFAQHTQREQHLYEKFDAITNRSVLMVTDRPILPRDPVIVTPFSVVFYNQANIDSVVREGFDLAKVSFIVNPNESVFTADISSYAIGLVSSVHTNNTLADVWLSGLVDLTYDIDDETHGFIQSNEADPEADFTPGPFFLSRTEAGKVTRNPGGVSIYVGYAFNRRSFLLSPNVSAFNQFYTTYRYNILDRPAGYPVLSTGTWTITNVNTDLVGWVPVGSLSSAMQMLAPEGATFFYNLPGDTEIEDDTGIATYDRTEQIGLAKSLPPNPPNLTLLVINGIIQNIHDEHSPDGSYIVTDVGIWWFDNTDGLQPWSSDIETSVVITANTGTQELYLADHGFELGDIIQFTTTGTLPGGLSTLTNYYVVQLNVDGDHFKVSASSATGASPVTLTTTGSGVHTIRQPYIWKSFRGTDQIRPKTSLQFIRLNPTISQSIVTSLKPYNASATALRFYNSAKSAIAGSGDLLARLLLEYVNGSTSTSAATAIESQQFDETTGKITNTLTPIVSKLVQGSGITITPLIVNSVTQPGAYIIGSATNTSSGRVSSIEPDGAELKFVGLHSYINMTLPAVLPSSLVGKITLPDTVPNADMTFVLLMIGSDSVAATKTVEFEFTYAVTKANTILNTTVSTPVTVSFNMPNPYTPKTCFLVGNATDAIAALTLTIPAAAFAGGNASVNFSLARKLPDSNPYNGSVGIVDIYWKIG